MQEAPRAHQDTTFGVSTPHSQWRALLLCALGVLVGSSALSSPALADPPAVLGDLDPLHPNKLSKEQLEQLMPGTKMSRKVYTGSTNYWTNEPNGSLIVSTDNRGRIGASSLVNASTAPGKWHIAPDGRYCLTIEWKRIPTEDWCRYVFETSDGYYASKSDQDRSEKVHKLEINGK